MILLVRHGQASTGEADYDRLTPLGLEQSGLLGPWLNRCGLRPDRIVTGQMLRHRQTAGACIETGQWSVAPRIEEGFNEFDRVGVFALGREPEEALHRWIEGAHDQDYRESWPAFSARCLAALRGLGEEGITLVATSAGPITAICRELLDIPRHRAASLAETLMNGSITVIEGNRLRSFNSVAYLQETGRPELVTNR